MRLAFQTVVLSSALILLTACSDPKLVLMNRQTGEVGQGAVMNSQLGSSGSMTVSFPNETYVGTWVAINDPGSVTFGLLNAYSSTGGSVLGANSTGYTMSTGGFGTALLSSDKGNTARCEVRYDSWNMTAAGICRRQDGIIFDLQMSPS